MKVLKKVLMVAAWLNLLVSCNNGLTGNNEYMERKRADRGAKVAVDAASYVDFTVEKYNANMWKKDDLLYDLGNRTYKNGNSIIRINRIDGTMEITSDKGRYNGRENCQVYGKYKLDILAASSDCLYIRRNPREAGTLIIDNVTFINDQIPDLLVCVPLYGYSKNRIEVSSVMNGYILMPSGTYWNK